MVAPVVSKCSTICPAVMLLRFNGLSISRRGGADRALNVSPKDMDGIPPFTLPDFMCFFIVDGANQPCKLTV